MPCGQCHHFESFKDGETGKCLRYPPSWTPHSELPGLMRWSNPVVSKDAGCGEYHERWSFRNEIFTGENRDDGEVEEKLKSTVIYVHPVKESPDFLTPENWPTLPLENWFISYVKRQMEWSSRPSPEGFDTGDRTEGICKHIESEVNEVRAAVFGSPERLTEWCDIIILALDGCWRNGFTPHEIMDALEAKQKKNKSRLWPAKSLDEASFHVKKKPEELGLEAFEHQIITCECGRKACRKEFCQCSCQVFLCSLCMRDSSQHVCKSVEKVPNDSSINVSWKQYGEDAMQVFKLSQKEMAECFYNFQKGENGVTDLTIRVNHPQC